MFPSRVLVLYHGVSSVALKGGGGPGPHDRRARMVIPLSNLGPPNGGYGSDYVIFCYCNDSHLRKK